MPVQEESEKWPKWPKWPKPPYKTNHFNCHLNSYYLWSQNAEFPNSWGHHFRWLHISAPRPRCGFPVQTAPHLRNQRQLPEARPCLEAIQGEEKEDHEEPSHQIGHQSREEPGGCWMLDAAGEGSWWSQSRNSPSMVMEKLPKNGFHEQLVEQWWNTSLVGDFNHLEKYESMGKIIPYMKWKAINAWNHQPVVVSLDMLTSGKFTYRSRGPVKMWKPWPEGFG